MNGSSIHKHSQLPFGEREEERSIGRAFPEESLWNHPRPSVGETTIHGRSDRVSSGKIMDPFGWQMQPFAVAVPEQRMMR